MFQYSGDQILVGEGVGAKGEGSLDIDGHEDEGEEVVEVELWEQAH